MLVARLQFSSHLINLYIAFAIYRQPSAIRKELQNASQQDRQADLE